MDAGKSPEWLPPGFTEKIKRKDGKKIKYYLNDATGAKYHSKKDVINAATTDIVSNVILDITNGIQTENNDDDGLTSNNKVEITSKTNDSLDELPNGWIVEEKPRSNRSGKGSTYKVYIDSSSGSKFYSRAAVARYLNSRDHANTTTVQNKLDIVPQTSAGPTPEKEKIESSLKTVATMSPSADELPPGWIKEMKTCKSGDKIRKYPVYIDSSSGHKFSSRAAVTRYLNTVAHANTTPVQNKLGKVDEPLPDMSPESITNAGIIPEKKRKESSSKKVCGVTSMIDSESTSADGLPPGWIKKIKISNSGNKRRKVPVYINTSSGTKLFSRVAVDRYVNSVDHADTTPLQIKDSNVDEPLPDMSQQLPMTNASPITDNEKKKKESSYKMVATVSTSADGLPPGWIKEIRTSQCGDKIRKEPYYTDPVSGYVFRSKPDVLRYLKNGDIRYCACRPKRKELDDPKLTGNEIPVSIPVNEQANPELHELTSKCIYWQNQAQHFEEQVKAVKLQLTKHDEQLKKVKEKEARLVATLEASLSREEQKSSQFEASQNELNEKNSQLEIAQKELDERRKEVLALTDELSSVKEKVLELEKATNPLGPKGFDINRFDPFRVNGSANLVNNPTSTSTAGAVSNPQEDDFATLFGNQIDREQGQNQPRWPRFF